MHVPVRFCSQQLDIILITSLHTSPNPSSQTLPYHTPIYNPIITRRHAPSVAPLSHTLVTHVGFNLMKTGGRTGKLGEQMASEHDISIHSFVQKVYGEASPIIEFDVFSGIYNINGEPVWPV